MRTIIILPDTDDCATGQTAARLAGARGPRRASRAMEKPDSLVSEILAVIVGAAALLVLLALT